VLDESLKSSRLVINYCDASAFVKTEPEDFYDGIIIDSTDAWNEDSPSYVLTTPLFYKDLWKILKKNCGFS
jgi:spermidine synthase